ncbi:amidohydrolase family protein [Cellulophaga sp. F20128]|uniref:amidohydrolase family protein n=1 Tax=Cellulophaga sp. F20128 TaxID=2926413 RepID=UPI001FF60A98|nr:amidohydrolase family protein [Cellulophaga sp. F20128]MCK0156482.1 amidohydrolase family protein [Cellulophaga sp. F20128]
MKIDSHQHFWKYNPADHIWINDTMSILKRDYLPEDLKKEFGKTAIDGSVAVQASQSEAETNFLISLAKENKSIKAIVGWADLRAKNIDERLSYFIDSCTTIKGFRHVVHDEPNANFILGKAFNYGISQLEKYNLTYDILIFPIHLEATIQFIKAHPNQKFIIDHIAKPYIEKKEINVWKSHMQALSTFDNVWCKVSGMVTETKWHTWKYEDFEPYLDVVFESFGTNRVLFGSDWPVCLLSASYVEVKGIIDQYISKFSEQEKNKIMGKNAIAFYGIDIQQK